MLSTIMLDTKHALTFLFTSYVIILTLAKEIAIDFTEEYNPHVLWKRACSAAALAMGEDVVCVSISLPSPYADCTQTIDEICAHEVSSDQALCDVQMYVNIEFLTWWASIADIL